MKKTLFALAMIFAFTFPQSGKSSTALSSKDEKVTICHRTGNGEHHTIVVSINAVPAHLAHGDALGDCDIPTISK